MTNQELNARAAEIMGVPELCSYDNRKECWLYQKVECGPVDIWNPAENIAQAFELAEKMPPEKIQLFKIFRRNGKWAVSWRLCEHLSNAPLAELITRACVAAAERK